MRRRMSFWIIGMLLSLLPTTAFSSDGLTFNNARTEGQAYYDLPLTIYVNVTNNGAEDYYGWWSIGNKANWENFQSVEIKTGETKEVAFETIIAQTGNVTLSIFDLTSDQPLYTFTIQVDTAQPKISGSVHLNLQETPDKGLCMFCDFKNIRIYGSATITNGELFDIYEKSPTAIGYRDSYFKTVLMPQIGDKLIKSSLIGMPEVIKGGETVNVNISINFEGTPEEGQEYVVQILYMDMVIASSEPFTFIRSTNTYWTADGNQRPLSPAHPFPPVSAGGGEGPPVQRLPHLSGDALGGGIRYEFQGTLPQPPVPDVRRVAGAVFRRLFGPGRAGDGEQRPGLRPGIPSGPLAPLLPVGGGRGISRLRPDPVFG